MASISNKEALKDKIHEIHNYLRNNGAGYGMNALKTFNVLYGLKKIEEKDLLSEVELSDECKFSYLVSLANEGGKDEFLAQTIIGPVLDSIHTSKLKDFLLYEIPRNIKGSVFSYLVKQIDSITKIEESCNVLLSGKIYEYFIGRDESAISELGAYFTDRHIVDYILEKLSPCIRDDGSIPSMIDPFGGSGGFTTGYINFINTNYPEVDWSSEINKISHFDINEDVIKSAGLEIFCLTGVIPNMDNLKYKNAFKDDFGNGNKYDIILTNPPYGGDKTEKSEKYNKREKVKKYINDELSSTTDDDVKTRRRVQLRRILQEEKVEKKESEKAKVALENCSGRIQKFAKKNGELTGNDKESCSLMLLMDLLEVGGTAIGVLKEGVFFNKTYKDLRRCLLQNFNVREVISVPQDQFENTSTKTSIVIFDNTEEKTRQVKFSDLTVERISEDKFAEIKGNIVLLENKGDIYQVRDTLVSVASVDEILENPICSLNGKDYGKKELIVGKGYEKVKLGDLCEIICGKNLPKDKAVQGIYNVYGGGSSSYTHNEYNLEGFNILLSRVGNNNISLIDEKIYLTDNGFSLKLNNEIIKRFIGYYLIGKKEHIFNLANGSAQKVITKTQLKNLEIPIPKSPLKIKEWVDKISAPYNEKISKQAEIQALEDFVRERMREIELKEDCEEKSIIELTKMLPNGKHNTSFGKNIGKYKFYNSSNEEKLYCDQYEIEDESVIIGFKGNINIHLGKQFTSSQHMYVIQINHKTKQLFGNIIKYLYYLLKNNKTLFTDRMHGSTIKHITKNDLNDIKISLPKNKQLIQDLEPTFSRIETLQDEVKAAENLYKTFIQELSNEALPQKSKQSTTASIDDEVKSEPSEEVVEELDDVAEKPKKSKSSSSAGGCPYIPSRGKNKGVQCGVKSKSGEEYCSTHKKSSRKSSKA